MRLIGVKMIYKFLYSLGKACVIFFSRKYLLKERFKLD